MSDNSITLTVTASMVNTAEFRDVVTTAIRDALLKRCNCVTVYDHAGGPFVIGMNVNSHMRPEPPDEAA